MHQPDTRPVHIKVVPFKPFFVTVAPPSPEIRSEVVWAVRASRSPEECEDPFETARVESLSHQEVAAWRKRHKDAA